MSVIESLVLALVEGLTEFLPVSSTGHLILTSHLLNISQTEFLKNFEIIIQLGAISAVIVFYFRRFFQLLPLWKNIIAAFIPSAVVGLVLYKFIKDVLFESPELIVASLFLGGIAFILFEKFHKEKELAKELEEISLGDSFLVGLFQSLSIVPGVSRAGATIFGGLVTGLKRKTAVEFSFLLAVPTILGATTMDLYQSELNFSGSEWVFLGIGVVGSFITALLVIKFFLNYVQNNNFVVFGVYRVIIAALYWLIFLN